MLLALNALALGTVFGFVLCNFAVNRELTQFIRLGEIGFVALVTLMSVELGRELRAGGTALKDSEARFRTLFDQSQFSIKLFAPDGRTLRVNPPWEMLWGVDVSDPGGLLQDRVSAHSVIPSTMTPGKSAR